MSNLTKTIHPFQYDKGYALNDRDDVYSSTFKAKDLLNLIDVISKLTGHTTFKYYAFQYTTVAWSEHEIDELNENPEEIISFPSTNIILILKDRADYSTTTAACVGCWFYLPSWMWFYTTEGLVGSTEATNATYYEKSDPTLLEKFSDKFGQFLAYKESLVKDLKKTTFSTPNISDIGFFNTTHGTNELIVKVYKFSGAASLHVQVWYNSENGYDYGCVWEGEHPEYTPQANYSSSISGKLSGKPSASERDTYVYPNYQEYTITGDSCTIGWRSDVSVVNTGMYAIVNPRGYTVFDSRRTLEADIANVESKPLWDENKKDKRRIFNEGEWALRALQEENKEYWDITDNSPDNINYKHFNIGKYLNELSAHEQTLDAIVVRSELSDIPIKLGRLEE